MTPTVSIYHAADPGPDGLCRVPGCGRTRPAHIAPDPDPERCYFCAEPWPCSTYRSIGAHAASPCIVPRRRADSRRVRWHAPDGHNGGRGSFEMADVSDAGDPGPIMVRVDREDDPEADTDY